MIKHMCCSAAVFVLAILAVLTVVANPASADTIGGCAAPGDSPHCYTYTFSITNIYATTHPLVYSVSDLDPTVQYSFIIWQVDPLTNETIRPLHVKLVGPNVTSATWLWSGPQFPESFNSRAWESTAYYPMRVTDQFGQTLSHHFVAPTPNPEWELSGGTNLESEKQSIGGMAYHPITGDYHHNARAHNAFRVIAANERIALTTSITRQGDYTLLHYRFGGDNPPASDETIEISNVATGAVLAEFFLIDLYNYNKPDNGLVDTSLHTNNFVVINTDGIRPLWVNGGQDDYAFVTGDNPHSLDVSTGVYSYARLDSLSAVISFGESVWVVTSAPDWIEWRLDVRNPEVISGRAQRVERRQITQSVHNGLTVQSLSDDVIGPIDLTNHPFTPFRRTDYTVNSSPGNVVVSWLLESVDLRYGQNPADFGFETVTPYQIIAAPPVQSRTDRIRVVIVDAGLDTDAGSLTLLIVGSLVLFVLAFYLKAPAFVYVIFFVAMAGALWYLEVFSGPMTILVGLAVLLAVYLGFMSTKRDSV